jgi:arsenate reductase
MSEMIYLHNPRCRKSREGLDLLREHGHEPEVREYLNDPLTSDELLELAGNLDSASLEQWIRKGEPEYKENFKGKRLTTDQWAAVLEEYPKLLERPVLIVGQRAVIGRPPERLLELLR